MEFRVDGYPRQVWLNAAGEEMIESYSITHMAHGTPLATGDADNACGAAGPFLLEVGISSSFHIAKFFGLTSAAAPTAARTQISVPVAATPSAEPALVAAEFVHGNRADREHVSAEAPDSGYRTPPPASSTDIGAIITQALQAAGLMKRG